MVWCGGDLPIQGEFRVQLVSSDAPGNTAHAHLIPVPKAVLLGLPGSGDSKDTP